MLAIEFVKTLVHQYVSVKVAVIFGYHVLIEQLEAVRFSLLFLSDTAKERAA